MWQRIFQNIKICWSFGNNGKNYLYSREIETWKKALHYARVFKDFSLLKEIGINTNDASRKWVKAHRDLIIKTYQNYIKETIDDPESLQSLESLQRLEAKSGDYQKIKINKNSIIYCDIPYENTAGYGCSFDYERFYKWCEKQTEPLFISSYSLPEDNFVCIDKITHRSIVCSWKNSEVVEKVFIPKHQASTYHLPGSLFNFCDLY